MWKRIVWGLLVVVGIPAITLAQRSASRSAPPAALSVVSAIPGPDGKFDYASVDSAARRLYVARGDGVSYVDLTTGKLTSRFVPGTHVHSVTVRRHRHDRRDIPRGLGPARPRLRVPVHAGRELHHQARGRAVCGISDDRHGRHSGSADHRAVG